MDLDFTSQTTQKVKIFLFDNPYLKRNFLKTNDPGAKISLGQAKQLMHDLASSTPFLINL